MAEDLPDLPWPKDALEPHVSQETIEFHYGKHHLGYVTRLNKLIAGTEFDDMRLEEIVRRSQGPIFENAAQAWNHTFYWKGLSPGGGGEPEGRLAAALERRFGSFARFREAFSEAALEIFGSGWAWLVRDPAGELAIERTSNADNPLTRGDTPLLACDVWEHAYYIDVRNQRAKHVESFWKLVDWGAVSRRFEA